MKAEIKIPDGWRHLQAGERPIKGDRDFNFTNMTWDFMTWDFSTSHQCDTYGQTVLSDDVIQEKYTLDSGYMVIRKIKVIRKKRKAKK